LLFALFADIHSNLAALEACLAHARSRGAERTALLGDLVGYAAEAGEVVERAAALSREGGVAVKGNHDAAIDPSSPHAYMNDTARAAIEWTQRSLEPAQKAWLAALPLIVREEDICLVHATANRPERFDYVDGPSAAWRSAEAAERPYTFCGHVHDQLLYFERGPARMGSLRPTPGAVIPMKRHRRWVAIVGSVGQPRDGNPDAAYALFDSVREEITFYRVPYDSTRAEARIREAGLPDFLAYRIARGV
jgi:diadenosine tetraphosphatase ApaH/serine/threonine PP2A family protein phosphatase